MTVFLLFLSFPLVPRNTLNTDTAAATRDDRSMRTRNKAVNIPAYCMMELQ